MIVRIQTDETEKKKRKKRQVPGVFPFKLKARTKAKALQVFHCVMYAQSAL